MNQADIKALLDDIAVVSGVPANHKINFKTKSYTPVSSYWGSWRRLFGGESRSDCAERINELTTSIQRFSNDPIYTQDHWTLFAEIPNFIQGIQKLSQTYEKQITAQTAVAMLTFRNCIRYLNEISTSVQIRRERGMEKK